MNTPTPRTDAEILRVPSCFDNSYYHVVMADFARQLERENAALREVLEGVLPIFSGKYLLTSEHELVANARSILANTKLSHEEGGKGQL